MDSHGSWKTKDAKDQWLEWRTGYRDLQSFIYSCRRISAVAGPYRFHSIVLYSGRSVVGLFRQLVEQPEAKKWIHNITCLANLLDKAVVDEARAEWALQVRRGFRIPRDLFVRPIDHSPATPPRPTQAPGHDNGIALTLFNRIVGYADNLDDLLLAYPDDIGTALDQESLDELLLWVPTARSGTKLVENSDMALVDPSLFPATSALQRLSSLRLYCHLQGDQQPFRNDSYTQRLAAHCIGLLPEMGGLKSLELCGDALRSWAPVMALDYPAMPNIESIRLYGSRIHEPELVALCRACTNLQTLLVHFEESAEDDSDRWRLPGGKTLDEALLALAGTLQHLELAIVAPEAHFLTRGDERPRKRENHRLTCFPKLHKLRHLTIDFRGLFGTLGILEYDDGERLRHMLPRPLRSLTLVCEWGTERDLRPVYLANLDMVFHGIMLLCTTRSPKLSNICLAMHTWPMDRECKYRVRFRKSLDDVRARCRRAGIHFSTQELLPSYWDEDVTMLNNEENGTGITGSEDDENGSDGDEEGLEEDDSELEDDGEGHVESGVHDTDEEDQDSEYYFSGDGGDDIDDLERDARRPATFDAFIQQLGPNHGHDPDELYFAYHEDRWDEYLF